MRVLLTWELGHNVGHLTRLLPIAQELKRQGHALLAAVRDLQSAAPIFGPAGIPLIQAPHLLHGIPLEHRPSGYADILLSQGWADPAGLWGLTQGWLNIFGLFKPDHLIIDYSPTASLAARIAKIPTLLIGNGFELPPTTDPLPPFPGFVWASADTAAKAEKLAIGNANSVARAYKGAELSSLSSLVEGQKRLFATLPELDHYGEREDAEYIGPLLGKPNAPQVSWPEGDGPRIFATLKPDTVNVKEILEALAILKSRVVCVAMGFSLEALDSYRRPHILHSQTFVDLDLLRDADLCITYGAEGTMLSFLLAGVPQLMYPWHVEAFMAGRKLQSAGVSLSIEKPQTTAEISASIRGLLDHGACKRRAAELALKHRLSYPRVAVAEVVAKLEANIKPTSFKKGEEITLGNRRLEVYKEKPHSSHTAITLASSSRGIAIKHVCDG